MSKKSSQDFFDKLNNLRITDPEIIQSVKERVQQGADKRAAGELEG